MKKIMLLLALLLSFIAVAQKKTTTNNCRLDGYFNDKTNEMNYTTPLVDGIILKKIKNIKDNISYIGMVEAKSTTKITGNGVQLLFENGDFISDPEAKLVEQKLDDGSFSYVAVFIISDADINSFALSKLKGGKVGTVIKLVSQGDEIKEMARCLIDK